MSKPQSSSVMTRERVIIRTSVIGILANIVLAAFKAAVGLAANSIAVVLDAVNNLSDALSSVVTIAGTRLAGRAPDREHPLGYGRIEYLTAMIVSGIVLYAGITAMTESVKKILHPEPADYSTVTLIILVAAVAVKLLLGSYVKAAGERVDSASLVASGSDAKFDAILSASVLASALIYIFSGVSLEAWVGVAIAVFIIRAAIEMMRDTLNDILGKRTDKDLALGLKRTICADPDVHGAYDLFLYNYGPGKTFGSIHVEVPDTMTADTIDAMTRRLQQAVLEEHNVILTGIGIYAINTSDDEDAAVRHEVYAMALKDPCIKQVHGFYLNREAKTLTLDLVIDFDCDRDRVLDTFRETMENRYPGYRIDLVPDIDITE